MNEMRRAAIVALALTAALLASRSGWAAELSIEQVRAVLGAASPSKPADLAGKDLSDLDLSSLDFRSANLRGVSFFGSKLVLADFRGAKLEGANLNGAWLMGTDFTGANLNRASLLSVVILGGEVKKMPIFKGANMSGVRMIADLPGADLSGADFSDAMSASTSRTREWGRCGPTFPTPTWRAVTRRRRLQSIPDDLLRPQGRNLRGANFFRVKLGGADLTGADVTGADFTEADLDGTVFRDVKGFVDAIGLDKATNASSIRR